MSARDTGETPASPSGPPADPPTARPSWDTGARPAAAPPPAAPRPLPAAAPKPYYAAAPPPPAAPPPVPAAPPPAAPAYQAEDVKYDLSGNPIPSSGAAARPLQGQTSFAPTPGVWPPQPTAPPYGASSAYGMSGENGTDKVARLRWNWGAFLIPFWWCIFNGQRNIAWGIFAANTASRYTPAPFSYVLLLAVFGISVYLGLTGHRLAWASGRAMGDYDDFIRQQRAWMIWGFVIVVVATIALAALFSVIGGLSGALGGGGFGHPTGGSAPYPRGGN